MDDQTLNPIIRVNMVYLGRRLNGSGKVNYVWKECGEDFSADLSEDNSRWYSKSLYTCKPGTVIRFAVTRESGNKLVVYHPKTGEHAPEYVGVWLNHEARSKWNLRDSTVAIQIATKTKAAKAQREGLPMDALEPFRKAYFATHSGQGRAALLALIIEAVTEYKPPKR